MYQEIAGSILAGGKSSRMGGIDKALLLFKGKTLIEYSAELCLKLFDEVIIITSSQEKYGFLPGNPLFTEDRYKNCGPLAGLHAGLSKTGKKAVFFTSCDMPLLSIGLVRRLVDCYLISGCDILLPRIGDRIEPLCGVYRKGLEKEIETLLKDGRGYSVRRLLSVKETKFLDLADTPENRREFFNINSVEDLTAPGS